MALELTSLLLAAGELLHRVLLPAYVATNVIAPGIRAHWLAAFVLSAPTAIVIAELCYRRSGGNSAAVSHFAALASPVLVVWAIPPLLSYAAFDGRGLDLLLALTAIVIALEKSALLFASNVSQGLPRARWPLVRAQWVRFLPEVLAAGSIAAYCVIMSLVTIRIHHKLYTSSYDLGLFENLFYNSLHGTRGFALGAPYFSVHAELILYALLPFYALFQRTETLLVIQSVLLGTAGIPLFLLAHRWLKSGWQTLGLLSIYLLYPAVYGPNLYEFHFVTLSVFFILWAAWFFFSGKAVWFWIAVSCALICREDVALSIGLVGCGMVLQRTYARTGGRLAIVGLCWFFVARFGWMPKLGPTFFLNYYTRLIPPGHSGFLGLLETLASNPLFVLSTIATKDKLILALSLLVPVGFLPVRQPRTLFLLVPGFIVVGLSTDHLPIVQWSFQYVCHFVPYIFIATAAALAARKSNARWPPLLAGILAAIVLSVQWGIFRYDCVQAGFQTVSLRWSAADDARAANLASLISVIPNGASVSAGEHEGPHVARRRLLFSLKNGIGGADQVLFGLRSLRWGGRDAVLAALDSGGYGVIAKRGSFVLLGRGLSTLQNAEVADWLRKTSLEQDF